MQQVHAASLHTPAHVGCGGSANAPHCLDAHGRPFRSHFSANERLEKLVEFVDFFDHPLGKLLKADALAVVDVDEVERRIKLVLAVHKHAEGVTCHRMCGGRWVGRVRGAHMSFSFILWHTWENSARVRRSLLSLSMMPNSRSARKTLGKLYLGPTLRQQHNADTTSQRSTRSARLAHAQDFGVGVA
jgi:hypothetical protein